MPTTAIFEILNMLHNTIPIAEARLLDIVLNVA